MKRNPVETILGFFVLLFAGVFLAFFLSRVDVQKVNGYPLFTFFRKVGGLEMGADVRIGGIKVGSVTAIELDPKTFFASVQLTIKDNVALPIDTVAVIADAGVMGDKYIRLEPGKDKQVLTKNDTIKKVKDYRSLEENVSEFIFLSTQDDKKGNK